MAWPNLTAEDLEARIRTYLNEATAKFYTQAEIWKWISVAARDIAEKTLCVRRVLTSATGGANVRNVVTNALKVIQVEYVGTRPKMLTKIDPLRLGHYPLTGDAPQYWYEHGTGIEIEPMPDAVYSLRLYIADVPKLMADSPWTDWTTGTGWTLGDTAAHAGTSTDITLTAGVTSGRNYTFEFNVTANAGSVTFTGGAVAGTAVTTVGYHTQTITPDGTTLTITGVGSVTIDSLTIYQEVDISAGTDQIELPPEWYNMVCLSAAYQGLLKDKQYGPAALLASINANEAGYLARNVVEVTPDGRDDMKFK